MRACVLQHPRPVTEHPLELAEVAEPVPGPGEVLIEVTACGVCRTDLQLVEGDLAARRLPIVPGHQVVGRVVALGAGASAPEAAAPTLVGAGRGLRIGDRVGVAWLAGVCGRCEHCRAGRENLCESATFTGWDRDGGYAERLTARADMVALLPEAEAGRDGADDLDVAPLLCGGVIGFRCLRVAEVQPGQRLGLYGFGASATVVIQVARHWGCEVFVCTRSPAEQARARALGAVWAGGYDEPPPAPLDAAVTFAPVGSVVVDALRAVRRGGIVAVNAIHLDRIPEFPYELLWWERQIRSVANVTRADIAGLLALAPEIPIRTQVEVFPLAEAGEALSRLAAGRISGAAVLRIGPRDGT